MSVDVGAIAPEVVYAHALSGEPCDLILEGRWATALPVASWLRAVDDGDRAVLAFCAGPTIDLGCGPGRMTAELTARGQLALGIDVVYEAVAESRRRGAIALCRDVFGPLPGEGRWHTVLLADENAGLGGDPVALLSRVRRLLAPEGRVVVEVAAPGVRTRMVNAVLRCRCGSSEPFPWSVLGVDELAAIAEESGMRVLLSGAFEGRWVGVLTDRGLARKSAK